MGETLPSAAPPLVGLHPMGRSGLQPPHATDHAGSSLSGMTIGPEPSSMKDAFYTFIEINGTSSTSIGDAINWAIKRAHETLRNLRWFEVMETRGKIKPGKWSNGRPRSRWGFPWRIDRCQSRPLQGWAAVNCQEEARVPDLTPSLWNGAGQTWLETNSGMGCQPFTR